MIRDLVASFNLKIHPQKKPGVICAVSTLESVYQKYGYQTLHRALRLIIGAWEGDCNSFSAAMIKAVAKLVDVYGDELDDNLFVEKLGAVSIKQLSRNAKERRAGFMGYVEAIVIEYNGKKKNPAGRLQIGKLYTKNGKFSKYNLPDDFLFSDNPDNI